ncbi:MAG: helix-turn-helix domain-containing protein [Candidatus Komeilibacteria bacterium]|nr:helix-turn-helix domain-containing protein [Candidatus Komeilibacteria bacterium]
MTSFIAKKLTAAKALPEILREEREKSGLTLEDLSLKIQVSLKYLKLLENGDYDLLPGEVYALEFLKKLAKHWHLNEKAIQQIYRQEKNAQLVLPAFKPKKKFHAAAHWLSPRLIKQSVVGLVLILLVSYLGWEIQNIYSKPALTIISPQSETVTTGSYLAITGQTEPETAITINQQEILAGPDGSFNQTVDLTVGLNVFKISASKKHSQANTVTISILRKPVTAEQINQTEQPIL